MAGQPVPLHTARSLRVAGRERDARPMWKTELNGSHTHVTENGVSIHIYERQKRYLGRGSLNGQRFGEDLGPDAKTAAVRLRRMMTEIEDGTYIRASERRRATIRPTLAARATLRQIVSVYVERTKQRSGTATARRYCNWLQHAVAFAEQPAILRRWPCAREIDLAFCVELRAFLAQRPVARNGRTGGTVRRVMSVAGVREVLRTLQAALVYAKRPEVALLPASFVCPIEKELLGHKARKDPLRPLVLPLDKRVRLVQLMDKWELIHVAPLLVLPIRPDELCGLLVTEVDFEAGLLRFPLRFGERDGSKNMIPFAVPFPPALVPLVRAAINGRVDGPLFLTRRVFEGAAPQVQIVQSGDLEQEVSAALARHAAAAPGDAKAVCRAVLRAVGGTDGDELYREFKRLVHLAGVAPATLYHCRHAVTTELERINAPMLSRRYATGH
jgi:integrase